MQTLERRNLINFAALNEENKKKSAPLWQWQPFPRRQLFSFLLFPSLCCVRALSGGAVSFSPESRIAFYIISRGGIFRIRSALAHFSLIDLIRLYCICCKEATNAASRKLSFKKTPTSAERERDMFGEKVSQR
jgi:hypothetical protein